ncbi:hypothetical protein V5799_002721, partial [Amblyomma americanum]
EYEPSIRYVIFKSFCRARVYYNEQTHHDVARTDGGLCHCPGKLGFCVPGTKVSRSLQRLLPSLLLQQRQGDLPAVHLRWLPAQRKQLSNTRRMPEPLWLSTEDVESEPLFRIKHLGVLLLSTLR